jgi:hypothetical protein
MHRRKKNDPYAADVLVPRRRRCPVCEELCDWSSGSDLDWGMCPTGCDPSEQAEARQDMIDRLRAEEALSVPQ